MSQAEEDPELRELVTEALEKSGVLAAVRAHLRAGVFLALEREHDQKRSHQLHQMLNTHDGRLALLLVHELLEFCRLRHTASVYSAETGQPNSYAYKGRESLLLDLKLTNENTHLPVLVQLISVLFKLSKPSTSNIKNGVEPISQDNYDTTFTSDSTNHSQDGSKASLIDLNGSEENDKSSEPVEEDKFSSVSEQSLDAHIELHTDSEKSYSNVASLKPLNESVGSEVLSDDAPNDSVVKDVMSPKIDEIPPSERSDRSDVLNEIEDNSVISKLDVLSDNPSQNSSKTQANESIIEEIIEHTDKSSMSSSHITEVPSSKYSTQNLSDETSSFEQSKSQIDPKSGNQRKKLVKENVKSKPQVSKSKINLNISEKRHSKPLKKTNELFPHTQDKINATVNKSAIPSGNKVNSDKNSSKLVKATQIDNVNGSE